MDEMAWSILKIVGSAGGILAVLALASLLWRR